MSERRLHFTFKRNDVSYLLDGLEAVIEEFKYDGGLILAEDYIRLAERLRERLGLTPARRAPAAVPGGEAK